MELLLMMFAGYMIGRLHEKWIYYRKTGKWLEDVKQEKDV